MRFLDAGILIVGFLNTSKTNSTLECPKESRSVKGKSPQNSTERVSVTSAKTFFFP